MVNKSCIIEHYRSYKTTSYVYILTNLLPVWYYFNPNGVAAIDLEYDGYVLYKNYNFKGEFFVNRKEFIDKIKKTLYGK